MTTPNKTMFSKKQCNFVRMFTWHQQEITIFIYSYQLKCVNPHDGCMGKPENSSLTREVEKLAKITPQVPRCPENNLLEATVIDFIAYARSVPIKSKILKTFGEYAQDLYCTFERIIRKSGRLDIVFDLHLPASIKSSERNRRMMQDPTEITIYCLSTPIPVEIDRFWSPSVNKQRFQQFFIDWLVNTK